MDNLHARRAAENQALFREVNERIEELNERFEQLVGCSGWTCECSRLDCAEHVEMTIREYEAVRTDPRRFVVTPGHQDAEVEHVVARSERYWIVEKIGAGAAVAEALDPRAA